MLSCAGFLSFLVVVVVRVLKEIFFNFKIIFIFLLFIDYTRFLRGIHTLYINESKNELIIKKKNKNLLNVSISFCV